MSLCNLDATQTSPHEAVPSLISPAAFHVDTESKHEALSHIPLRAADAYHNEALLASWLDSMITPMLCIRTCAQGMHLLPACVVSRSMDPCNLYRRQQLQSYQACTPCLHYNTGLPCRFSRTPVRRTARRTCTSARFCKCTRGALSSWRLMSSHTSTWRTTAMYTSWRTGRLLSRLSGPKSQVSRAGCKSILHLSAQIPAART